MSMNFKTPYFVIDEKALDDNYKELISSLDDYWKNYIVGYSYKTNSLPWIIEHFKNKGAYAEVVSDDEYNLAKLIGVETKKMIYNGPIKTKETFLEALLNGCIVNIETKREIEWLTDLPRGKYNIGIRVNFDVESFCPNESQCGNEGGRFGFCYENGELKKAIEEINKKGFKICGLHLHTSSKTRSLKIYDAISRIACEIKNKYKLNLTFVDVGGGFFGGLKNKPKFNDYLKVITSNISKEFNPNETTLIVEPGMSVIGAFVSYVTSVIDVKDTIYNRFVVTDGSRLSIDPFMNKQTFSYRFENNKNKSVIEKQVICGYTCIENDRLFIAKKEAELSIGDKIIYDKVGAYTICFNSLFIKYFPEVYVKNTEYTLIRNSWQPEEYIQKSLCGAK